MIGIVHGMLRRVVVLLSSAALAVSGLAGCATREPGGPTRIAGVLVDGQRLARADEAGLVRVLRDGIAIDGRSGMELRPGDRVETSYRAEAVIHYASGSELFMRPRSSGRIGSFTEFVGEVFAKIRGAFAVETTFVRAAAEGTAYLVRADADGRSTVMVFEGRVRVDSTRGAWAPVTVHAGQMVAAHPQPPRPMAAPEAELQATRAWVERLERLVSPPAAATPGAAAPAIAVGVLLAAILASRDRDRDRGRDGASQAEAERSSRGDAQPPPLVAPSGLSPGDAKEGGVRFDCRRGMVLSWAAVAGARDYLVRLDTLDAGRNWRSANLQPTGATRIDVLPSQLGSSNRWSVQARDGSRVGPSSATLAFGCDFAVVR